MLNTTTLINEHLSKMFPLKTSCAGNLLDGYTTGHVTLEPFFPYVEPYPALPNTLNQLFSPFAWRSPGYGFSETIENGERILSLNVPGCSKKDVKISLKGRIITAQATYKSAVYDCSTTISDSADLESIRAVCKNGILSIRMKDKEVLVREIVVE